MIAALRMAPGFMALTLGVAGVANAQAANFQSGKAQYGTQPVRDDAICLGSVAIHASEVEGVNQAAALIMMYFLGKLRARNPDIDIANLMTTVVEEEEEESVRDALRLRCYAEFSDSLEKLDSAGDALMAAG